MSVHTGDANFKIKAGDRMPYFTIGEKSVFDFLRDPKFHLLVFSEEENKELFGQIETQSEWIDCQNFALAPRVKEIFGADESFAVLLRPDNHIGLIGGKISFDELKNYPFLMSVLTAH